MDLNENIIIIERFWKKSKIVIAINRSNNEIRLPEFLNNMQIKFSINESTEKYLKPFGGIVLTN